MNFLHQPFSRTLLNCVFAATALVLSGCGDSDNGNPKPVAADDTQQSQPVAESAPKVSQRKAWPVFRGSPDLSGDIDLELSLPLELKWEYSAEMPVLAAPVSDGENVYIGDGDGNFLSLSLKDGSENWKTTVDDGGFEGTACIIGDKVIVGSLDGFVYAYEITSGNEAWKFETMGQIVGGINTFTVKTSEGDVPSAVFGSHDNKLYCVDARDGSEQWSVETGYYLNGTPCIADGKIVFGGCDGIIYVVNAQNGSAAATVEIGPYVSNSIILKDDIAYVAHYEERVEAFNITDGSKVWEFAGERSFPYFASPAVTEDRVFAPGQDKRLHCLDRKTGQEAWNFRAAGRIDGSPIIAGNHVIFGADDGILYFVDANSGKEVWQYEIGDEIKSSALIVGDTLVIGASDGKIYAFQEKQE
jgi:outer membrane protein assembly factor BamB